MVDRVHHLPVVMRHYNGKVERIGWYFWDDQHYTTRTGPFGTQREAREELRKLKLEDK